MLGELVPIYHALAAVGISPLEVDQMEIWQVAAMLSYVPPPPAGTPYSAGGVDPNALARARAGQALEVGRMVVPPRSGDKRGGSSPLAGARRVELAPGVELTDAPVST